jgi:hypothetical protein
MLIADFIYATGSSGLIATIMHKSLAKSYSARSDEADIGFERKKVPDTNERLFDNLLGTLLNG